jgi:ParB/RepB/Spo0J family partition protein
MQLLPVRYSRVPVASLTCMAGRHSFREDSSSGPNSGALLAAVDVSRWIDCILVRPAAPDRYEVIDGEARVAAARAAGEDEIDVAVVEVSDQHATLLAALANLAFRREGALSTARACLAVLDALPSAQAATQARLAKALGRSQAWVSGQLTVARALSDDVLAAANLRARDLDNVPIVTLRALSRSLGTDRREALQRAGAARAAGQSVARALRPDRLGKSKKRSFQAQHRADGRLSVQANLHQLNAADAKQLLDALAPAIRLIMARAGIDTWDAMTQPTPVREQPAAVHAVIIRLISFLWRNLRIFFATLYGARRRDGSLT